MFGLVFRSARVRRAGIVLLAGALIGLPLAASACLLLCYLLWLKADVALFRS